MTNIPLTPNDSAIARIRHAEEYLDTLKNQVKSWMDEKPYSVIDHKNADHTRHSITLRINTEPPLQKWSLIASDIVHSLRCALDHTVYAIAVYESGQEVPRAERLLMFTICDTRDQFEKQDKMRLKTLSQPVRAAIESLQPYNRPHEVFSPLLSILRDFDDTNKHRLLMIAFSAVKRGDIGLSGLSENHVNPDNWQLVLNPGELKDGSELAAVVFHSPAPDAKFDRRIFDIILAFPIKNQTSSSPFENRIDFTMFLRLLLDEVKEAIDKVVGK